MAYKRQIDRLPIPPRDAKVSNAVCHFCIVGCGYKAYTWDVNRQGGPAPEDNVFGHDLRHQQATESPAWYAPSMYNTVRQSGRDVHIVLKPDHDCVVNSGLGSIRGARMAEMLPSAITGSSKARLTEPLAWRYGALSPTSWEDALWLVAEVTRRVIEEQGEDGLIVSAYDHGGAGGGYENVWATGKLYFDSMKVRNIRIHNRPAYNSEVHGTRDMGIRELHNCYEDAELADTLFIVGANSLETQTNYFLNHWVPNLRGATLDKKRKLLPDEPHGPGRLIMVDPRRTVTVDAAEAEAGHNGVLHLQIRSGTDLVLFNALLTEVSQRDWFDEPFVDASTVGLERALIANRTTLEDAAGLTGLSADTIRRAAAWIAEPKGGKRRRTMFAYEKGLIWGNDNYRTNQALVNLALATGNVGRVGGGCVRLGGHLEGYVRPSDAHVGRPATNVDRLLISGQGSVHHVWGCDAFKTTLDAAVFKRAYKRRTDLVKQAMDAVPAGDRSAQIEAILGAIRQGGLFCVNVDIMPSQIGSCAHVVLSAATSGEMNLTSMNGERRMRLTERYMDPPGQALPDCMIVSGLARALERSWRSAGKADVADKFRGYDWQSEEDAFLDGYHKHAPGGEHVTYDRLRAMGTNGFQEPATGFDDGRILGTQRLYEDGVFDRPDGRAAFQATIWRGLEAPGKRRERETYRFLINNGRSNHVWQSAFLDQHNAFVADRFPFPPLLMHPDDVTELGLKAGDLVEIWNGNGATQALVWPERQTRRDETFLLFAHPAGPAGNVVGPGTNELVIPNFKQTWANIRKLADQPEAAAHLSFKQQAYRTPA